MAQPITCDTGCGDPAALLVTMISSGDVQGYCAPCYEEICVEMLAQSGRIAKIVEAAIMATAGGDGPAPDKPARPRKGKATTVAAPAQDTAPLGESTPDQQADTPA